MAAPKFYLFDLGVTRFLRRLSAVDEHSSDFGKFFEQFIFLELLAHRDYTSPLTELNYWRSERGHEVDFVVGDTLAIEVKSGKHVSERDLVGLCVFGEEKMSHRRIVVSREPQRRTLANGIEIFPWQEFLELLWKNALVTKRVNS